MPVSSRSIIGRSARVDLEGIDFNSFETQPLAVETLRCLRYMCDVESHTICYLREILATSAHRDPDITAFLACWNYEEFWHGEALGQVLELHRLPGAKESAQDLRRERKWLDELRLLTFNIGSLIADDFVAIQMCWGAINELTAQAAYARMIAKAQHPELSELVRRIMKQEGRHLDFYEGEARKRLLKSRRAQRLARFALTKFWAPVGSGVVSNSEVAHMASYLFADEEGLVAAQRVDRKFSRLPGLDGLTLLETAARRGGKAAALRQ
ncbi:ferritin-like domain-containing protein [Ferrimicrobium sp.]|uniref:ferritin-like domain-containing protein n=1 Tax=Ferrimicrobium sp. TaxID=2926050 RepID=UPI00260876D3|nr:ferritin-like domain-containing protein [Ferrimicrobium sp.]